MKLAMAQMKMSTSVAQNLSKSLAFCDEAKDCDLLFFPEIQFSPFFPQYSGQDAKKYLMTRTDAAIRQMQEKAAAHRLYLSPNVYYSFGKNAYDASLWIDPQGNLVDVAKMVHIAQAKQFYEQDYYTPSDDGFKVFTTPFGNIGIVICYDRHLPESIRSCTLMGADLILVPTANCKAESMEMFMWEIRVQAMQNQVFIAMCNRVGREGDMDFSGESLLVHPSGEVLFRADDREQLVMCEIDLEESKRWQAKLPYLSSRRPEWYR